LYSEWGGRELRTVGLAAAVALGAHGGTETAGLRCEAAGLAAVSAREACLRGVGVAGVPLLAIHGLLKYQKQMWCELYVMNDLQIYIYISMR